MKVTFSLGDLWDKIVDFGLDWLDKLVKGIKEFSVLAFWTALLALAIICNCDCEAREEIWYE